eukprot:50461-Rhodomonas_salina.4
MSAPTACSLDLKGHARSTQALGDAQCGSGCDTWSWRLRHFVDFGDGVRVHCVDFGNGVGGHLVDFGDGVEAELEEQQRWRLQLRHCAHTQSERVRE